jgi:RNA polymerase sigma factor (sigma-70 family)
VIGQRNGYNDYSDEELMKLVLQGDRSAFGVVYDRYADRLMRYFYRLLWQDHELAGDMVQDLFTKIIHKPHLYDPSRPLKTWLFSVASNMVKNQYKRAEVRKVAAGEFRHLTSGATTGEELTDTLELTVFSASLETALNGLEPHHRDTFVLRYKEGLSVKEVAEVMECSDGTVKSRLFYAVRKLAEKLKEFNPKEPTSNEEKRVMLTPKSKTT